MTDTDCERLHDLGAEIALGIADGEDRAWALDHLADCPRCRARIERLSSVADELLLVAPAAEPPAGFEDRVGETISGSAIAGPRAAAAAGGGSRGWRCRPSRPWPPPPAPRGSSGRCSTTTATSPMPTATRSRSPTASTSMRLRSSFPGARRSATSTATRAAPRGCWPSSTTESQPAATACSSSPHGRREAAAARARGRRRARQRRGRTAVDYDELAQVRLLDSAGREVAESDLA